MVRDTHRVRYSSETQKYRELDRHKGFGIDPLPANRSDL